MKAFKVFVMLIFAVGFAILAPQYALSQTVGTYTTQDGQTLNASVSVSLPAPVNTYWRYASAAGGIVNTTTAVTLKTASGAGVRNYVSSIHCGHDTLGAATEIVIRDGAAGTVMWRGKMQTASVDSLSGAGGVQFVPPLQGTANTLTEIATVAAVTGGVYCNVQGFTGP